MILKSFEFQCDFDFQITTSKMIWILILIHLYSGDLILILKSSTYDDFAHLWKQPRECWNVKKNQLKKDSDKKNISETVIRKKYLWKQW